MMPCTLSTHHYLTYCPTNCLKWVCHKHFVDAYYLFFTNTISTVIANGVKSRMIWPAPRILPRHHLWPPLFNIYLNHLPIKFTAQSGSHMALFLVVMLAYADNIKVLARSYEEACRITKFIIDECSEIGLTIHAYAAFLYKCFLLNEQWLSWHRR